MNVEQEFPTKRFAEADHGALLNVMFGRSKVVRGLKAFHVGENGERNDFFVSIGPFLAEHGERPVVYAPSDLSEEHVLDVTGSFRIQPSLTAGDLGVDHVSAEEPMGTLLLDENRTYMRVANFGRAGPHQFAYLDLSSGEIVTLDAEDSFLATRRWRIVGPGGEGEVDFEFTAAAA